MHLFRILVVDDDTDMATSCVKLFRKQDYAAEYVTSGEAALDRLRRSEPFHILLTDIKLGTMDGVELMRQAQAEFPQIKVILMTGYGSISDAVSAIKFGASDYLTKPFNRDELLHKVGKLYHIFQLENEVTELQRQVEDKNEHHLICQSSAMTKVMHLIDAASRNSYPVIITGESGTGKELVAQTIHRKSARREQPFITLNCGALPSELVESELFGYRKGAFTGADRDYDGLFRAADRGTLLLDEITEMAPMLQVKLLRVIQEKKVRPMGETKEVPVDVSIITATNQDIHQLIAAKRFREDLYFRLKVIEIHVPPLRQRIEEIELLVNYFIQQFNRQFQKSVLPIDSDSLALLQAYTWPGNVRELEHTLKSIFAVYSDLRQILPEHLPKEISQAKSSSTAQVSENAVPSLIQAECHLVKQALAVAGYNKKKAAEILGISRTRLYKKIEDYNIKLP